MLIMAGGWWVPESRERVQARMNSSTESLLLPFLASRSKARCCPPLCACVGVLVGYPICRRKSPAVTWAYGLLGCAIGLTTGVAWTSRHLGASVASGALKNIGKVRDEQWLTKNPVNYA
jgi:hypothetical protein